MNNTNLNKFAIVSLGSLFPDAKDTEQFWQNIINKKVSIQPLPEDYFESEIFYRPELFTAINKQEKSFTNLAARIDNLHFDTVRKYKIPPSVAEHMDDNQHAALYAADQAIESAGLDNLPTDRVAVIFGNGMVGTRYGDGLARIQFNKVEHYLKKNQNFLKIPAKEQQEIIDHISSIALKGTIPISEDSAPGILPNIIAARISSVFDFHGPSFTIDAACASVLAAVITGIQGLLQKQYDAVICGGADMPLRELGLIYFSAINALSPNGSFPFDKRANGFVMGQGAGALVLKRLEDAVEAQDKIYAVISGYGQASDGKGKYIAAPNAEWQARTIMKACHMAGYPVDTIEMIEAHGTATVVGDVVEVDGLRKAFDRLGSQGKNFCGLTSVKSNIGHLKSAAGIAGLTKAVLALHHKQLPPTASFEEINPKLQIENSPFYVIDELRDWPAPKDHPRRANVSSFGFGGADYHLALEEYRAEDYSQEMFKGHSFAQDDIPPLSLSSPPGRAIRAEVLSVFAAESNKELDNQVKDFISRTKSKTDLQFSDICKLHNHSIQMNKKIRLAICAESIAEFESKYNFFVKNQKKIAAEILKSKGIFFKDGPVVKPTQIAILFPGQASQYINMFRNIYDSYPSVRTPFDKADAHWFAQHDHTISSLIFPKNKNEDEALEILRQTQNAHPVIFISSLAIYELLKDLGLSANYMIGHSLGEITALAAGGKIDFKDALKLVEQRGFAFSRAGLKDPGQMISVKTTLDDANKLIDMSGIDVFIANINGPEQIIVAGSSPNIKMFKKFLDRKKIANKLLYVSHAFHTPLLKSVAESFYKNISGLRFTASKINVIMNHTGTYYPKTNKESTQFADLLKDQILQPVNFVRSVEKLYKDGVRLFIETGPNSILSALVKDILKAKKISVLASNYKNADDLSSLQKLLGGLFVEGVPLKPEAFSITHPASPIVVKETETIAKQPVLDKKDSTLQLERRVLYSGVSIGLPGSYKETFRDDNFEQVFAGHNFIERLTDAERQRMVDLQISKLIKDESGPTFKILSSMDDVIQLAGKIGKIDLIRDYHIDEKEVKIMTSCIANGVAAGFEALKDAHIPLVREYKKTSTGTLLPQKLALPDSMQEETGVIFANGFPLIDPVIEEVSRFIANKYGSKTSKELMNFYESIISHVKDEETKKLLTNWYTLYYSRLTDQPGIGEVFRFNHHFMMEISAQANNRLASLINAKGPNFQMNAACSSTSNAITIAEDFIRTGRVERMIVVGADDPTSSTNFPYLGAGFLCTGAATNESDLYSAAVPFDRRRNGMIISAGAVGIILESKNAIEKRGVSEVCELLGTHSFNTAAHPSQIDSKQFSKEMERFISRMEEKYRLKREELARQSIYISHETYTPARGGCAQTEADALKNTFGDVFKQIIIGNTKGMTGHTMGAALEDAIAAKSMQLGKCPPVVNYSEPDPEIDGLNLWKGGRHDRQYALKMSAGFGSQGNFALLKKSGTGKERIIDKNKYNQWLQVISGQKIPETELSGRILIIKESNPIVKSDNFNNTETSTKTVAKYVNAPTPKKEEAVSKKSINNEIIELISEETQYPPEMLEPEMEFGSDLGIDSDLQDTIYRMIADRFSLQSDGFKIEDETTIGHLIDQVRKAMEADRDAESTSHEVQAPIASSSKEEIRVETLKAFSEVTKYPEDMLELDMEMEADLGIDTVKQATILSILGEKYMLERDESIQLSNYPTIGHMVDMIYEKSGTGIANNLFSSETTDVKDPKVATPHPEETDDDIKQKIKIDTLQVFSEVTKYPEDMLELDMEMEADLGIDTVKQATILSILGEKYMLERDESMQLSDYPTIGHIVDLVYEKRNTGVAEIPDMQTTDQVTNEKTANDKPVLNENEEIPILNESSLSRQVLVLTGQKIGAKNFDLKGKKVWILGENNGITQKLAKAIRAKKAAVSTFNFPEKLSDEKLNEQCNQFITGSIADVIVDASHIGRKLNFKDLDSAVAVEVLEQNSTARFIFYKNLEKHKKRPQKILCLTSIDGSMAVQKQNIVDPTFAALKGFYKALRKEWPESHVSIVDYAPTQVDNDFQTVTKQLISEIEHASSAMEIVYHKNQRKIVQIDDREIQSIKTITYDSKDTFLITGGGSGLGALLLKTLAHRYRSNFIIVDIVPIPDDVVELIKLDQTGLENLKQDIHINLKTTKKKVTPVMLERAYDQIIKAIDLYRIIQKFKELGCRIEYIECDVRDYNSLKDKLSKAKENVGPVTAILHAAGMDISHLIEKKSVDEFRQVFGVKAIGAYNLLHLCKEEPLKLVVAFASISGRFGNAAQLDYSAANAFLNHWIKSVTGINKGIHALSIQWSGWKDVGIAWRNEYVREYSEKVGLNFIELQQGLTAFINEIENQTKDREIILHNGLNGFIEKDFATLYLHEYPLIDRISRKANKIDRAYRMFSVKRDALIDQHRLGSVPILPAVAYSELAVEYYALQEGKKDYYLVEHITFENAFKLFYEKPRELFIEGKRSTISDGWDIEIKSTFKPPKAMEAQKVLHSRSTVSDTLPDFSDMNPDNWPYKDDEPTSLPAEESLMLIKSSGPEQRIILGPLYNDVLRESEFKEPVLIYPTGTTYPTYFPLEQIKNDQYPLDSMLTNPCFVDSLYQACAAHLLVTKKRVYLPWEVGQLGIVNVPRTEGMYRSYAQVTTETEDLVTFNVVMIDEMSNICYFAREVKFRLINL